MSIFEYLLKPYKSLFKNSGKELKKVKTDKKTSDNDLNNSTEQEMIIRPEVFEARVGKILWKKKK